MALSAEAMREGPPGNGTPGNARLKEGRRLEWVGTDFPGPRSQKTAGRPEINMGGGHTWAVNDPHPPTQATLECAEQAHIFWFSPSRPAI